MELVVLSQDGVKLTWLLILIYLHFLNHGEWKKDSEWSLTQRKLLKNYFPQNLYQKSWGDGFSCIQPIMQTPIRSILLSRILIRVHIQNSGAKEILIEIPINQDTSYFLLAQELLAHLVQWTVMFQMLLLSIFLVISTIEVLQILINILTRVNLYL